MDIIPKFYIFGVPDGFDMLGGTSAEITYFQKFYNGSTENAKFSIHRDAKGNMTYTYLRYNLSSYKSRTGSFFGMSLIFNSVYCANPLRLYELFDWVYDTYIISDKGFITPVNGSKDIQARYEIARFQDKSDYIHHYIEAVLLGNIKKEFSNKFYSIDSTFSNERPNLVVQEPMQSVSNERLLADLRQYNRVAVSPDWLPEPDPDPDPNKGQDKGTKTKIVLAPEYIVSLLEYTKGYQNYIIDSLNDIGAADIDFAKDVYREVAARLKEAKTTPSSDKRVSQIIRDYTTLTEQLQNLIQKIEEGPTPPPPPPPPTTPTPWWKNPKIIGVGIAALVIMIVLIIGIVYVLKHSNKEVNDRTPYIEQKIRNYISQAHYDDALQLAGDSLQGNRYRHFADTIEDIQILQCINDTLIKLHYSDAWDMSLKIHNKNVKDSKQEQIKIQCTEYLQTKTDEASTKQAANGVKSLITGCRVPIANNKKQAMITKLDGIIKTNSGGTGGGSVSRGNNPEQNLQYQVIVYETNRRYSEKQGAKRTITTNTMITGPRFVYCITTQAGGGIDDPNSVKAPENLKKPTSLGPGWYGTSGAGVIRVKKGNLECEITIKN